MSSGGFDVVDSDSSVEKDLISLKELVRESKKESKNSIIIEEDY